MNFKVKSSYQLTNIIALFMYTSEKLAENSSIKISSYNRTVWRFSLKRTSLSKNFYSIYSFSTSQECIITYYVNDVNDVRRIFCSRRERSRLVTIEEGFLHERLRLF